MRVIDRLAKFEYIAESDRSLPKDEQTIFILKGLPYDTQQQLEARLSPQISIPGSAVGSGKEEFQKAMSGSNVSVNIMGGRTELQFEILKHGMVDVVNLYDDKGNVITYPGPNAPLATLKNWYAQWLPSDLRTELANAITEGSTISEDDAKN